MRVERLLAKMQLQAEEADRQQRQQRRYEAAYPTLKPEVQEEQKLDRLCNLRKQTADINFTLELDRQLEAESKRNLVATMKLRESRLTAEERKARDTETRRGQILLSRVVLENHPDWKQQENPNAEIYRQQRKPKS
jgi:hypothetical protein